MGLQGGAPEALPMAEEAGEGQPNAGTEIRS